MQLLDTLEDLSPEALEDLGQTILVFAASCGPLVRAGMQPRFDLTPGCDVVIRTGWTMPGLAADPIMQQASGAAEGDGFPELSAAHAANRLLEHVVYYDLEKRLGQEAADAMIAELVAIADRWPRPAPDAQDHSPALDPLAKHVDGQPIGHWPPPISPEEATSAIEGAERSEVRPTPVPAEETAGAAGDYAAPAPVATIVAEGPEARSAVAAQASGQPLPWTDEENTLLIETMAYQIVDNGLSWNGAAEAAAGVLGRPVEGTKFRTRNKLKTAIDARIAERSTGNDVEAAFQQEGTEAGQPTLVQEPVSPPAVEASPLKHQQMVEGLTGSPSHNGDTLSQPAEAGAGAYNPDLLAHVRAVKHDKFWTLERDRDLLHFAIIGWPANDIALEIKVPVAEVNPRFKVLTRHNAFKRTEVLAALEWLLAVSKEVA
ncbi:MAG: hypothetical protein DI533_04605 [Cereibacter sphaeroides]|uniref:Uncharacterized protein n=1 Tax=Cereibacter sphaeroides TaxID=1063 RepID=A0A2W5TV31_CERSP|nr:MAG: hypothetical protein DI533_04605 [Cereibacter sphaeroides]